VAVHPFILTDQRIASGQIIGFNLVILSDKSLFENCMVASSRALNHITATSLHQKLIQASRDQATYDEDNQHVTHTRIVFEGMIVESIFSISLYQEFRLSSAFT
jgi:hypothetical protein